ncbi:hypothetical protein Nepgr_004143 [Nepenthes gracilis]|uniref:[histone H3]-lysine(27) N-trimethyltransferase n=1 Tax=Nepenthes gracilis TaxID=150966 RepID=A0AAD3S0Y3_NEPGR|nr:hypothetical protein Nepgr_004143 [Nepenthes gracilis]
MMLSNTTNSLSNLNGEQGSKDYGTLISKINQLKKQIQADRMIIITEKLEKNAKKLESHIHQIVSATLREDLSAAGNESSSVLYLRNESAIFAFDEFVPGSGDKDFTSSHEAIFSTSTKLPYIERIPPYTTWIFLARNQRMGEDQSVVGRRRIYYDERGSEALICSDSEEEIVELEEEKYEFSEGEDRILWMAFQEHGLNEEVVNIVSQFIGGTTTEIQERYSELKEKFQEKQGENAFENSIFLEKSLSCALDSLDNLFCRRCLVFDCRLHGCSQNLIFPSEKLPSWSEPEDNGKLCSDQCYFGARKNNEKLPEGSSVGSPGQMEHAANNEEEGHAFTGNYEEVSDDGAHSGCMEAEGCTAEPINSQSVLATVPIAHPENVEKRKVLGQGDIVIGETDDFLGFHGKKQKLSAVDIDAVAGSSASVPYEISGATAKIPNTGVCGGRYSYQSKESVVDEAEEVMIRRPEMNMSTSSVEGRAERLSRVCEWKPLEKELFKKGLEIFGRNSCLIARNLLSGLKTCIEVFNYMHNNGAVIPHTSDAVLSSFSEEKEQELPTRSRITRKRGKTRRYKYSSKSTGHPSSWRRIGDGKNHACKQYTPCSCQFMCGKQCTCLDNGTCCEKYCGCLKSCKNRFRGCHCAKSQCKSRQCPCFASNRECDPDVCRNCWISCGDGSLGEPARRSDGQCGNMKLLLRQQQQVLLARSDVAGWGAFIKNSVNKHDYLGEYTGELVSHREADKRGKIYDRANSSFLFDLNDQWVLDAYRKGDKLKFANHSSNPNCYCKIMLVAGDHRVGIYAKERIEAKEELFYDYRYGPNEAPEWARKPKGSKKDESSLSQGRAKKHQSH